ncbi:hypothetical protein KDW36_22895 [Burkholderia dolosa]|uniref:hypothetical protein n=1 Tax=Burkholderia dolosa TaxID=152500 RepID=UPI001B9FA3CF|nr:hypothetical protein [Burkholderia dolosa]MBR8316030.1 hypothetical protein [Burkholderia dolosa]
MTNQNVKSAVPAPADERAAYHFHRFVDGVEMAEGVLIERAPTLEAAIKEAVRCCEKRPMTVLVHAPAWAGTLCGGALANRAASANQPRRPADCGPTLTGEYTNAHDLIAALRKPEDERAAFPRYTEWLHLRTHGEWSNGVPEWARDHTGRMNDFTAATAVIEELAALASRAPAQAAEPAANPRAWLLTLGNRELITRVHIGLERRREEGWTVTPLYAAPQRASMPALTDAMRAVLTNDAGAFQSPDALYAALCEAARAGDGP